MKIQNEVREMTIIIFWSTLLIDNSYYNSKKIYFFLPSKCNHNLSLLIIKYYNKFLFKIRNIYFIIK